MMFQVQKNLCSFPLVIQKGTESTSQPVGWMRSPLSLWGMHEASELCWINNMRIKLSLSVVKRHVWVYHSRPQARHTQGAHDEEGGLYVHAHIYLSWEMRWNYKVESVKCVHAKEQNTGAQRRKESSRNFLNGVKKVLELCIFNL